MPEHLVERINASLAAEQAQRAAMMPSSSVTPMLTTARSRTRQRRHARFVFAVASAAAAVVLVAVVGSNMLTVHQTTATSGGTAVTSASRDSSSNKAGASGGAPPSAPDNGQTPTALAGRVTTPPLVQIGLSGTRYTQADFVAQARALRRAPLQRIVAQSSSVGPAGTTPGLMKCLSAIGATGAQMVRADVAFYEGQPAVIIVTTTNGIPMAYAVGRQCSPAHAAILRPATPLS
jgi:hypothetical protein